MELFLLHQAIIGLVAIFFVTFTLGGYKKVALTSLLLTLLLSAICHRLFRRLGVRRHGNEGAVQRKATK